MSVADHLSLKSKKPSFNCRCCKVMGFISWRNRVCLQKSRMEFSGHLLKEMTLVWGALVSKRASRIASLQWVFFIALKETSYWKMNIRSSFVTL